MTVVFRPYTAQDWFGLFNMYLTFEPRAAYQGLPPFKEPVTSRWLFGLVRNPNNSNFVLCLSSEIIGHASLVNYPNQVGQEEIIIFIHQCYQHRGWGRELFLAVMHWACHYLKLKQVWLTVEWNNVKARRLYNGIGFVSIPSESSNPQDLSRNQNGTSPAVSVLLRRKMSYLYPKADPLLCAKSIKC